ncbi:MAG: autoinducer binding domain-containing protein, partial [Alphaproteobacteria bacterium]|nr:autoinducer binding domain-containing protein [Alphaproteobacteria bacterium]
MSKHIDDFITLAQGSTDLADLSSLFEKIIRNMGFGEWAYQVVNQKTESKPLILGSYPESWVQHYVEQSYQKIDPVIINGPQQSRLFLWSGLKPKEGLIKKQEIFFNEAKEFGLKDGVGLPIH